MRIDNREYSEPELKSYIMGLQKRIADAENLNGELKKEKAELYEALENYCFASAMANTKEKKNNFDIVLNLEILGACIRNISRDCQENGKNETIIKNINPYCFEMNLRSALGIIEQFKKENEELNETLKLIGGGENAELKKENAELLKLLEKHELVKSLLEIAVFDMKKVSDDNCCYGCKHNNGLIEFGHNCERFKRESNCYKWEHEEQALKLIRGDE